MRERGTRHSKHRPACAVTSDEMKNEICKIESHVDPRRQWIASVCAMLQLANRRLVQKRWAKLYDIGQTIVAEQCWMLKLTTLDHRGAQR
jgi:hypothetical protein